MRAVVWTASCALVAAAFIAAFIEMWDRRVP